MTKCAQRWQEWFMENAPELCNSPPQHNTRMAFEAGWTSAFELLLETNQFQHVPEATHTPGRKCPCCDSLRS